MRDGIERDGSHYTKGFLYRPEPNPVWGRPYTLIHHAFRVVGESRLRARCEADGWESKELKDSYHSFKNRTDELIASLPFAHDTELIGNIIVGSCHWEVGSFVSKTFGSLVSLSPDRDSIRLTCANANLEYIDNILDIQFPFVAFKVKSLDRPHTPWHLTILEAKHIIKTWEEAKNDYDY